MCIAIGLGIAVILGFGAYQWNKRKAPSIVVEASNAAAPERKPE